MTVKPSEESLDLATKIANAYGGTGSIKCVYQNVDSEGAAYIKNGMVRIESNGTQSGKYGTVIYKDDTVWAWEEGEEGYMIENISTYQMDPNIPEEYKVDSNRIQETITQNEPTCNAESISDDQFVPPTTISFQNTSAIMENSHSQISDNIELPEGYQIPAQ